MSRRGVWFALAAAVGLAAAVAAWLLAGGEPDRATDVAAREIGAAASRPGPAAFSPRAKDGESPVAPVAVVPFAEDDELPAPRAFEPSPKEGVALEIVRKEDKKPVADAEVLWFEAAEIEGDRWTKIDLLRREPEEHARRLARRYRSDAEGRCVVPFCRELAIVMARSDALFGGLRLAPTTRGPLVLEVAPDSYVRLLVKDEEGAPAPRIPVDVCAFNGPRSDVFLKFVADERGAASIRNLGVFLGLFRFEPRAVATVGTPMHARPEAAFSVDPPPVDPVVLTVPAFGRLEVAVVDADEAPLSVTGTATVHCVGAATGVSAGEIKAPGSYRAAMTGGVARYDCMGVGLKLRASVRTSDGAECWAEGDGPLAAGETATLKVVKRTSPPVVVGRATTPEGAPIVERRLEFRMLAPGTLVPDPRVVEVRTNDAGEFVAELGPPISDKPGAKAPEPVLPDRLEISLREGAARVASTLVAPPPAGKDGVVSLGDVVFAPATPVVSGTVVDEAGLPVRFARIEVQRRYTGEELNLPHVKRDEKGRPIEFVSEPSLDATSDDAGAFVVRSPRPLSALRVLATRAGYREGVWTEIVAPATDVRLVLRAGAVFEGRLLLDADVPRDLVRATLVVRAEGAPADAKPLFARETQPEANGYVSWTGAPAGVGDVTVYAPTFGGRAAATVAGVRVLRGETTSDPRLNPCDLRGAFRLVDLEVVDSEGRFVVDADYETLPSDGEGGARRRTGKGRQRILAPNVAFDLRVTSERLRGVDLRSPSGFVRAILRDPTLVRLRVVGEVPRLDEGYDCVLELQPVPRPPASKPDPTQRVVPGAREERVATTGGEALLRVAGPGRYAVVWRVERRSSGKNFDARRIDAGPSRPYVDVDANDDVLQLDVAAPSAAAVERARRRM